MFKLLTTEQRIRVKSEYKAHRLIIVLVLLIGVGLMGFVGLFPSYILTTVRHNEVRARAEAITQSASQKEESSLREWLIDTNKNLTLIAPGEDGNTISVILRTVIELKPDGISLTRFTWDKQDKKTVLTLSGVARDRQTLIGFEKAIEDSGDFTEVLLPLSNLAKDKDIEFQISASPNI